MRLALLLRLAALPAMVATQAMVATPASAAPQCRLDAQACEAVSRELAAERAAEAQDEQALSSMPPRQRIPLLADIKVKRMVGRVRAMPKDIGKEYLRFGACETYAQLDALQGSNEVGNNDCN